MSQHNTRPQNVSGNILEHCTLAYIYGELLTSDTAVQTDSVETIVGIYNPIISQKSIQKSVLPHSYLVLGLTRIT